MHDHGALGGGLVVLVLVPAVLALGLYLGAVGKERARGRVWPVGRTALWIGGIAFAAVAVLWPGSSESAGGNGFVSHVWQHLAVGMVAPLMLVLAAPVTLALRALDVVPARRLSRVMKSRPVRILSLPAVAALLNVGGMWLLYTTPLFEAVQSSVLLDLIVHAHFLLAGYLFTAALVGVDPTPHRRGLPERTVVLLVALAAHGILAKLLFTAPPAGVPTAEAEAGSMLMFYGGDLVDAVLIASLCLEWYRRTAPDRVRGTLRMGALPER
jgi:putative membrane protein